MNNIQLTIQELRANAQKYTEIADSLAALFPAAPEPEQAAMPTKLKSARLVKAPKVEKPKPKGTKRAGVPPAPGLVPPAPVRNALGVPVITLGRAMKNELLAATKPCTAADLVAALKQKYPDVMAEASDGAPYANLTYWASKGYVEKIGAGALATFRVLDREFFAAPQT